MSKYSSARSATGQIIGRLQRGIESGNPATKRDLAVLRRAVGRDPVDHPDALGIVAGALDPDLCGDGYVSDCERAVYTAATLWAYHSQLMSGAAHTPSTKGERGRTIGHAVGELVRRDTGTAYNDHPIRRRWQYMVAADTVDMVAARARSIVSQLARAGIGFDYCDLAGALVHWETYPEHRRRALMRWSRGTHTPTHTSTQN